MKKSNIFKINAEDLLKTGLVRGINIKRVAGILFLLFIILVSSVLAQSVLAQTVDFIAENAIEIGLHIIVILSAISAIVFALKSTRLFAKGLNKGMWLILIGIGVMAVTHLLEMLHHLGGEDILTPLLHDLASGISFVLIAIGFYKVYQTIKAVSRGVKRAKIK